MKKFLWRLIKFFHPEGIPWPGTIIYNSLSRTDIFRDHYSLVAKDISGYFLRGRLLDVGTGPGWLLHAVRRICGDAELYGVDISASMVQKARVNSSRECPGRMEFVHAGSSSLPFENEYFDCVVSTGSIHHWKDIDESLAEIYRVLKKGACVLIYDLVTEVPEDIQIELEARYGSFRMTLLWLHSFEEPFYSVDEMAKLAINTPFIETGIHFTGALCCLVLKRPGK